MKHGVVLGIGVGCFVVGVLVGWQAIPRSAVSLGDFAENTPGIAPTTPTQASGFSGSSDGSPNPGGNDSGTSAAEERGSSRPPSVDDLLNLTVTNSHTKTYQNLSARLDRLDAPQFESLIEDLRHLRKDPRAQQVLAVVFEKFGEIAPREALALMQLPGNQGLPFWNAIAPAATALVNEAPDEALELFLGFKGHMRNSGFSSLFNAAATAKPELISTWMEHPEMKKAMRSQHNSWVVRNAVQNWAKSDPAAAAAFALSTPNGSIKQNIVGGVVYSWAQQDSVAAIAWAAVLEPASLRRSARASIAGALALDDPRAAIALIDDATSNSERQQLLSSIGSSWAQRDPDGMREWLTELEDPKDLWSAMNGCTHQIAQNPEPFLELLERVPRDKKEHLISNFIGQWGQYDPDAATEWARSLEGKDRKSAMQSLISNLSYHDAPAAAKLLSELGEMDSGYDHYVTNIGSYWAQQDPDAARTWAESLEDEKLRKRAIQGVISNWVNYEPDRATAYILENTEGKDRKNLISTTVNQWIHQDEDAAAQFVRSLPDEDRLGAADAYVQALVYKSAIETAIEEFGFFVEEFPNALAEGKLDNATRTLVSKIAGDDPAQAVGIFDQLPDGKVRENAAGAIARAWMNTDSIAASEWVSGLPEGSVRDAGAVNVIQKILKDDGEGAFIWATSLSGKHPQRNYYLSRAVTSVSDDDPGAARTMVANSGLSEEEQTKLLRNIK